MDEMSLVEAQLGYRVENQLRIVAWTSDKQPAVIETYPLRRNHQDVPVEPFPTLYWLTDRRLSAAVATVERDGGINSARQAMHSDVAMLDALERVHERYKQRRWSLLSEEDRDLVVARGWREKLQDVGVAGLQDATNVKCLHAHYAQFLVDVTERIAPPNPIGAWVHDHLPPLTRLLALGHIPSYAEVYTAANKAQHHHHHQYHTSSVILGAGPPACCHQLSDGPRGPDAAE